MHDLQLIGHITKDVIICENKVNVTLGAMANLWQACEKLNPALNLKLCPLYFGKALIFQDATSGNRYSKANLNEIKLGFQPLQSSWNHVFYLNHIPDLQFLSKLDGIISADICAGGQIDYDCLKYIDYLFIADEDLEISLQEMINFTKGYIICHSSDGSVVVGKNYNKTFEIKKIENLNVLGAGDYFATSFIINMLKSNNLEFSIKSAHKDATSYLLEINNIDIKEIT